MKYNKQLSKDYDNATASLHYSCENADTFGILSDFLKLMNWARQRTEDGYSLRETYKKLMPQLVKGGEVFCDLSETPFFNRYGDILCRTYPATHQDDSAVIVSLSVFFNTLKEILEKDGYDDEYMCILYECANFDETDLVDMRQIRYDPETGTK